MAGEKNKNGGAMGELVFLTEKELKLLTLVFDYGNYSYEDNKDEEETIDVAESIKRKAIRALCRHEQKKKYLEGEL